MRTTRGQAVVLNLPDLATCQQAKLALDVGRDTHNLTTRHTKKVDPKVMITNVSLDEACKTKEEMAEFTKFILQKNPYLDDCTSDDIMVVSTKEKGRVQHVIVKCSPKARQAIRKNNDIIYTTYGRHRVYDHYRVIICNHCQGYGHIETDCRKKDEPRVCGKCSEEHDTNSCSTNRVKCSQCARRGYNDTNHYVFQRVCPSYIEREIRAAANTDHGLEQQIITYLHPSSDL